MAHQVNKTKYKKYCTKSKMNKLTKAKWRIIQIVLQVCEKQRVYDK